MSRQTRCPECGSGEVEEDEHYTQSHLVCTQCGCVLTEGILTTTRTEEAFLQEVKYYRSTAEVKTPCRNQIHGLKRVRDVCRVLRLRAVLEETASGLYREAYEHEELLQARLCKKEALVGCCVYISCRQHSWPLTLGTVCSLLHTDPSLVSSLYLRLLVLLHIDIPSLALSDLVNTHCQGFQLFQAGVSDSPGLVEDRVRVTERAVQLVELAGETWLVTGRHPVPILTAAAYLAWQSLAPAQRLRYSLARFCKLCSVRHPGSANLRLRELCQVLVSLAARLPWLGTQRLEPKTVVKYAGDVLRHRAVLLRHSLVNGSQEVGDGEGETPRGADGEGGESQSTEWENQQGVSHTEERSRDRGSPTQTCAQDFPCGFLPPCLSQPKRRGQQGGSERERERPSSHCVTGDEEISDTEIELYLRTPQEVESFIKASALLL
ncbi:transcription factor IIIB 50 kDa subunit [Callorhinchus milii]|uniref:Transcription factor IIIB 50 kDa subunit n=1 Tax=Callorhinchus milii TaxID=7868 RepID=A0A4W3GXT0_CALMI|nr:transcription factor IIIB 50 kDa subunit [Callorhinchus milii]|eukprot:gi/632985787/ref/XP_007909877.1/ PREDICTED: transcription factor IIIB 50 kDa subunit [Callorhinchus milii]